MATITDLGAGVNTATNPPTTMSMTTTAALADTESVFVSVEIPNDNPTFAASGVTFAGHNMTEVVRMAKTGTGAVVLFGYKNATGSSIASGATVTATWTNTGTQLGGGAGINAGKCDTVVDPTTAAATGSGQGTSTTPTATSGTPSSSTKNYLVISSLGGLASINAAGQATPPTGYTAFTEGYAGSPRLKSLYAGGVVRTAAVAAETAAWSQTWGASKQWAEIVALFELAAASTTFFGTSAVTAAVAITTTATRKTFGVTATAETVSVTTAGTRRTFGSSLVSETATVGTGGRLGAFARSSVVETVTVTVAGTGGGPAAIVTVRLGQPSPSAAEVAGAPAANEFGPSAPRRA